MSRNYLRSERSSLGGVGGWVWGTLGLLIGGVCVISRAPARRGEHPHQHLRPFSGTWQADAYAVFHHLYEGGQIREAACWAHVRRKFYELQVAHALPLAAEALQRIAELYAIEGEIRGRPPDERLALRRSRAPPFLASFPQWL